MYTTSMKMRRPNLFNGIPTGTRSLERSQCAAALTHYSDLGLESSDWEGLHNGPCGFCLALDLLAKCHPHSCLVGRFDARLDLANSWACEGARLLITMHTVWVWTKMHGKQAFDHCLSVCPTRLPTRLCVCHRVGKTN